MSACLLVDGCEEFETWTYILQNYIISLYLY